MNTNPPLGTIRLIYPESVEGGRGEELIPSAVWHIKDKHR